MIVDGKDPYLQEWILQLNNTPHTRGYTMKLEQRSPRLQPEDIYALAQKDVSEREGLNRLNRGDKTTVTYTHRPSPKNTVVNAVNTVNPNTAKPTDTSVNAVGHPKPPAKKTADPGSKQPSSLWVLCSRRSKQRKQMDMDYHIDWSVTNSTLVTCKPRSPCNDTHWTLGVSLRLVNLRVTIRLAVTARVVVVMTVLVAKRAIKGEKERPTGADVGRNAQRSPLRRKKTSGTLLTLRWLSCHEGAYLD